MEPRNPDPGELFPPELDALWHSRAARWALSAGRRVRRFEQAHPVLLDSLLALVVLFGGFASLLMRTRHGLGAALTLGHRVPAAWIVASVFGQAVPLVLRRRAPTAVVAVVLACCTIQWWYGLTARSDIAVMIALYSMPRYGGLKRLPWVAVATVAGLGVAAFRAVPLKAQPWNSWFVLCSAATAAVALALVVEVRKAQLSALADRAARLEIEREQRVRLATFAERSRMSREMHDVVGHSLAVIIGLADGASHGDAVDPARSQEVLRLIASTGRQALKEVRGTLSALRQRPDQEPEAADLSPQPGLGDLSALLEAVRSAGPQISYRIAGDLEAVSPSVALAAYRIIQEALTNSLKHAGPNTTVQVAVGVTDTDLDVIVHDSGGPDHKPVLGSTNLEGQGLVGIYERAALTGGSAEAGPGGDGGWTVHAVLPLDLRASASLDLPQPSGPPKPPDLSEKDLP